MQDPEGSITNSDVLPEQDETATDINLQEPVDSSAWDSKADKERKSEPTPPPPRLGGINEPEPSPPESQSLIDSGSEKDDESDRLEIPAVGSEDTAPAESVVIPDTTTNESNLKVEVIASPEEVVDSGAALISAPLPEGDVDVTEEEIHAESLDEEQVLSNDTILDQQSDTPFTGLESAATATVNTAVEPEPIKHAPETTEADKLSDKSDVENRDIEQPEGSEPSPVDPDQPAENTDEHGSTNVEATAAGVPYTASEDSNDDIGRLKQHVDGQYVSTDKSARKLDSLLSDDQGQESNDNLESLLDSLIGGQP